MKRKKIPNSVRFEVFKRDKFKCQFCGRSAPDIVLEIDHLHPVSKGGQDDILNLITSCFDCNSGKSDRTLTDAAVMDKTRAQLEELEERRQQLEMMVRWRESLVGADDALVSSLARQLRDQSGWDVSESGRATLRRLVKEFGFDEVSEAVTIAADQYFRWEGSESVTPESFERGFAKLSGICKGRRLERTNPEQAELFFAFNIWKKNSGSTNSFTNSRAMDAIRSAHDRGVPIQKIKQICGSSLGVTRLERELGVSGD